VASDAFRKREAAAPTPKLTTALTDALPVARSGAP
jgi:hypothetical protein